MASPDCDLQGDTARSSPNGLINLVDGAVVVEDAGEEVCLMPNQCSLPAARQASLLAVQYIIQY